MEQLLFTVPEVAKILKTNERMVYKLINSGLLPSLKIGRIKIRIESLKKFLEKSEGYDVTDPENIKIMEVNVNEEK